MSIVGYLCCALTFLAFSFPAAGQSAPAAKAGTAQPLPEDPLGRGTPYGT